MRVLLLCSLALTLAACSPPSPQTGDAPGAEQAEVGSTQIVGSPQEALAAMPTWENARGAGVDFRAVGQEPGWLLDIYTRGIVKFAWDYGENYAEFAVAEPTHPQEGVTRYEANSDGRALVITIYSAPCEDAMSGQPFPAQVEVVIDGRALNGCGRNP